LYEVFEFFADRIKGWRKNKSKSSHVGAELLASWR
jgi:hypothetical protein